MLACYLLRMRRQTTKRRDHKMMESTGRSQLFKITDVLAATMETDSFVGKNEPGSKIMTDV